MENVENAQTIANGWHQADESIRTIHIPNTVEME